MINSADNLDIFVSTHPFSDPDVEPLRLLSESGFKFATNPLGRKLRPQELAEIAVNTRVLVAGTEDLRPLLACSAALQCISRVGAGLDSVPLDECKNRGITVCYTPDAVTPAVVELAVGLIIDSVRMITRSDREIRANRWNRIMGGRIGDSVVGVVGCGRIGSRVAKVLARFAPEEILICDIEDKSGIVQELVEQGVNAQQVSFDELVEQADIITLHVPLTSKTRNMFGDRALEKMKSSAVLVNTARGGVIDESALFQALASGEIASAAIDAFVDEPYDGPLIGLENVILTAHMGSCSADCRGAMELEAVQAALAFLRGEEIPQVVPDVEYKFQLL